VTESIFTYQDREARARIKEQVESDEDHETVIRKELEYLKEEGTLSPRTCNYCSGDWPCNWAVSRGIIKR